jgi:PAS domain S-box-containing protein
VTAVRRHQYALLAARKHEVTQAPTWLRREADGRLVYAPPTEEMRQLMGIPSDLDISDPMTTYSRIEQTPEETARYAIAFDESIRNLSVLSAEYRTHTSNGRLKWIRSTMTPAREPDGAIMWTGMLSDITREKAAESQVELLRSAVVHSTDAIIIFESPADAEELPSVLYSNPAFEQLTGFISDEIVGKPTTIFGPPDPNGPVAAQIKAALEHSDANVIELEIYRRDGGKVWVEGRPTIVHKFEDEAFRWVMVLRDIGDRRRSQQELLQTKDAAEAASRAKSEFLANMSHEIRTPMNGILGMTGLLLGTTLDAEQRKYADAVEECGESLLTIINDILDVSKLDAGKVELETIEFELVETVESALALLAPKAQQKGIELGVYVDSGARLAVQGDPNRLRQILLNLIGNGIKFTEKGSVSVEVAGLPTSVQGTAVIRFAVKDTGVGIPEDVRSNLFQKFSQADSSVTRRYGGTGLGLAISKQLVELMGGTIGVTSQPGLGSEFAFEIPLTILTAPTVERVIISGQIQGLRALAVDDIDMNLEIIRRQLQDLGMAVTCSHDAFDAFAELERAWHRGRPYDIAFLDQMMPGLSGDGLAARIRAVPHLNDIKMILVSSAGAPGRGNASAATFDAVLEKPLRQRDLANCLTQLYNRAPIAAHPDGDEEKTKSNAAVRGIAQSERSLRILLAEDNRINRMFALALLGKAGHRTDIAENGHQAVDAVRREDYDIVLMDVQMPELDGVHATKQIRALPPPKCDVTIIALTADAMSGSREQFLAAGMNDYISKPIDANILLQKLEEHAGERREV